MLAQNTACCRESLPQPAHLVLVSRRHKLLKGLQQLASAAARVCEVLCCRHLLHEGIHPLVCGLWHRRVCCCCSSCCWRAGILLLPLLCLLLLLGAVCCRCRPVGARLLLSAQLELRQALDGSIDVLAALCQHVFHGLRDGGCTRGTRQAGGRVCRHMHDVMHMRGVPC